MLRGGRAVDSRDSLPPFKPPGDRETDRCNPSRRRFLSLASRGTIALCAADGIARWIASDGGILTQKAAAQDVAPPVSLLNMEETADVFVAPARHWEALDGGKTQCQLCPTECEVEPGQRGECGVRENRNGEYKTLIYGRVVSLNVDPIEKKPLNHFLPGSAALSLAAVGCNIHCQFCQNWQISQAKPEEVPAVRLVPNRVASLAREKKIRSIAYTYSEPTVSFEFMMDTARAAREAGVRNVMISNGHIQTKPLLELCSTFDAIKIDFKGFNPTFYRDVCRGDLKTVLETLGTIRRSGVWLEMVVLVIPTLNDSPGECKRMCEWVMQNLGAEVPIHFTRFHPNYKLKNLPPTPTKTLERNREIARKAGLRFPYVGNVPGHPFENTYCPDCGEKVVTRYGFVSQNRLKEGCCPKCGVRIPGVWS